MKHEAITRRDQAHACEHCASGTYFPPPNDHLCLHIFTDCVCTHRHQDHVQGKCTLCDCEHFLTRERVAMKHDEITRRDPTCAESLLEDFYSITVRMLRAILNGHPIGHDAVETAKRTLRRANGGTLPDLRCHCTPCSLKGKLP